MSNAHPIELGTPSTDPVPRDGNLDSLPRWAACADLITLAFAVVALRVVAFGGARFHVSGLRVSLTSAPRLLLWALAVAVIRHLLRPRPSLYRDRPLHLWHMLRTSAALAHAWPIFVGSRLAVLVVGYLAVVTIGYAPGTLPWRVSENEMLNLPARWDAGWYLGVATSGYSWSDRSSTQQNIVFFPAYPMLIRVTGWLLGDRYVLGGVVVGFCAFLWALVYLYRLARELLDDAAAAAALAFLAAYPFALFFSAVYTESLFLLAAVGSFYHLQRQEPIRAGMWGLLIGLTRPNGFLGSLPLVILAVRPGPVSRISQIWRGRSVSLRASAPILAAAAMPICGMLIYSGFLAYVAHDPFAWATGHAAWGRTYRGLDQLVGEHYTYIRDNGLYWYTALRPFDLLNAAGVLFALALAWPATRRLGLAYGLFILVNVIPPMLAGGLLSMGRLSCVLFPAFMWLGCAVPARSRPAWLAAFAMGQALNAALFFTWRPLF